MDSNSSVWILMNYTRKGVVRTERWRAGQKRGGGEQTRAAVGRSGRSRLVSHLLELVVLVLQKVCVSARQHTLLAVVLRDGSVALVDGHQRHRSKVDDVIVKRHCLDVVQGLRRPNVDTGRKEHRLAVVLRVVGSTWAGHRVRQ
jgi:hypothetical protein